MGETKFVQTQCVFFSQNAISSFASNIKISSVVDCQAVVFFALVIRMRAVFERKVWSECEYEEWDWGSSGCFLCTIRSHLRRG